MLVLMAVFWVTECIPVAVTGLLPPLILPLTGVLPIQECSSNYWKVRSSTALLLVYTSTHWLYHSQLLYCILQSAV